IDDGVARPRVTLVELCHERVELLGPGRVPVGLRLRDLHQEPAQREISEPKIGRLIGDPKLRCEGSRRPLAAALAQQEQHLELENRVNVLPNEPGYVFGNRWRRHATPKKRAAARPTRNTCRFMPEPGPESDTQGRRFSPQTSYPPHAPSTLGPSLCGSEFAATSETSKIAPVHSVSLRVHTRRELFAVVSLAIRGKQRNG